jgi:hypothetical protein
MTSAGGDLSARAVTLYFLGMERRPSPIGMGEQAAWIWK